MGEARGRDGIRDSVMVRSEGSWVGEDVIGCIRSLNILIGGGEMWCGRVPLARDSALCVSDHAPYRSLRRSQQ